MDIKKVPVVFIIGHGRSGTTLLQSLLNTHPNVAGPTEYDFIIYLYPRFGKIKNWGKDNIIEFIDALFTDQIFYLWLMEREILTKKLLEGGNYSNYSAICKMLLSATGENKEDIKLLSDKNPINSLFVKKLMKIFPDAKFVHMIRDPRDSVNGHIQRLPQKNPFFLSWRWCRYNTIIERYKKKSPHKFFTIKYENMVKDIDGTMNSLCIFLNISYINFKRENIVPDRIKSFDKNKIVEGLSPEKKNAVLLRFKSFHENLTAPVNIANIDKWKKEMNPYNLAVTERITEQMAKKYGYAVETMKNNRIEISKSRILKSKIIFYSWELFTRWRYNNYKFNTRYRAKFIRNFIKKG